MEQKQYWQTFGDLTKTGVGEAADNNEFKEDLPLTPDDKGLFDAKAPRRDFLKFMGFSTAAAALAASCEMPVKKAIPFANKPEDIIPGVSNYYATTYVQDGEAVSILAKVRDGRPIKIEGNELCPITQGGTSARVQASVLDLYDTSRLTVPMANGKEVSTFEAFDKMVASGLASIGSAPIVLLTSSISSPTTRQVIAQFLAKYPGSRHVQYDAVSYSGILLANQASYGKKAIPSYQFDKAKVIVGLDADFLGTWVSPIEFSRQYAKGRKINEASPAMSRHIQFESMMSMTGANADERFNHRPSESGAVALALYNALGGGAPAVQLDAKLTKAVKDTAGYLTKAGRGAALVVSGSNDPNIQLVVNGINELLGANGSTIDWSATYSSFQGIDSEMATLVNDMNSSAVGALLIHSANPVYNYFDSKRFADGLKKVKVSISFNQKMDETAQLCKFAIPDHHFLESWGDAEAKTGCFSLIQPTIYPLFKTRQWQDSLLKWSGSATDYLGFVKQYWMGRLGSESNWDKALQDGVITPSGEKMPVPVAGTTATDTTGIATTGMFTQTTAQGTAFSAGTVAGAVSALSGVKPSTATELVLYQKIGIGAGQQANNPWLQELPDPVSKATWDNYAVISPAMARTLFNIDLTKDRDADAYEVHPEKQVVSIAANGKTIELPIIIVPGTNANTVAVALGYGRGMDASLNGEDVDDEKLEFAKANIGKAATATGKNAFGFVTSNGQVRNYSLASVTVKDAGYRSTVAQNQTTLGYHDRGEVVKETTLATLKASPAMFEEEREELAKDFAPNTKDFEKEATLYPTFPRPGIKWGMNIDLNSCTGCHACVVACHSENNVAIVGKAEVARAHDMHWLRIDRYFTGDAENPNVIFQPMLCQHCDNAPCENVCPVAATNHSSEGLNQMIYNRCIGTRYCGNNCPYKVRRFNWADYMGADSFPNNQVGEISDASFMMNDELTRMVLNPDVTVRSRGVIEKCTFCVQRLQEGKLKAKKESRPLVSGENGIYDLKTACQQACPTNAIEFGNVNDTKSAIAATRKNNPARTFYVIEMVHTLSNVSYLAKVRNTDVVMSHHEVAEEHATEEHGAEKMEKTAEPAEH